MIFCFPFYTEMIICIHASIFLFSMIYCVIQVLAIEEIFKHRVTNVVFMGMGEPMLNLKSVLEAHQCLNKVLLLFYTCACQLPSSCSIPFIHFLCMSICVFWSWAHLLWIALYFYRMCKLGKEWLQFPLWGFQTQWKSWPLTNFSQHWPSGMLSYIELVYIHI